MPAPSRDPTATNECSEKIACRNDRKQDSDNARADA